MLIFNRNHHGNRADAISPVIILADAAVPFPEFFLLDEFSAAREAEDGPGGEVFEEYAGVAGAVFLEQPDEVGMPVAVGPGAGYLFADEWHHLGREQAFFKQAGEHGGIFRLPGFAMRPGPSAISFPHVKMGYLMGQGDQELVWVECAVYRYAVIGFLNGGAVIAEFRPAVAGNGDKNRSSGKPVHYCIKAVIGQMRPEPFPEVFLHLTNIDI